MFGSMTFFPSDFLTRQMLFSKRLDSRGTCDGLSKQTYYVARDSLRSVVIQDLNWLVGVVRQLDHPICPPVLSLVPQSHTEKFVHDVLFFTDTQ